MDKASNLEFERHDVTVTDLRSVPEPFSLQQNGFQLERLEVPSDVDWSIEEQASTPPPTIESCFCIMETLDIISWGVEDVFTHRLWWNTRISQYDSEPDSHTCCAVC